MLLRIGRLPDEVAELLVDRERSRAVGRGCRACRPRAAPCRGSCRRRRGRRGRAHAAPPPRRAGTKRSTPRGGSGGNAQLRNARTGATGLAAAARPSTCSSSRSPRERRRRRLRVAAETHRDQRLLERQVGRVGRARGAQSSSTLGRRQLPARTRRGGSGRPRASRRPPRAGHARAYADASRIRSRARARRPPRHWRRPPPPGSAARRA